MEGSQGRITSARFNSDLPVTPAYNVDIEAEAQYHRHGSCSKCQNCGAGDEEDGMSRISGDTSNSSCPCCKRHNGLNATRPTLEKNNTLVADLDSRVTGRTRYDAHNIGCAEEGIHLQHGLTPPTTDKRKFRYEFFQGKNKFYFKGRLMTAPSIRFCLLSFGLIVVTFGLFVVFDMPYLTERFSIAIPIIGSILFVLVIVNMVRTSFSDPGILPRASQQEHEFIEKTYGGNSTNVRPPPRTKDVIVNGQTVKSKYCFTCKMFRPPRASHCGVCDNCVERFDHHCPFLGNCIGKRNYRSFYIFIISLSLLAVFVLSCSITHLAFLSKEKGNFLEALRESPTSAVVVLISFFGMWTVIGLAGFHTYLIAMEQTTNEDIKGLFGRGNTKNPYSRGNFCLNCCFVLCGPQPPSLINARARIDSDFLRSRPPDKSDAKRNSPSTISSQPPFSSYPPLASRVQSPDAAQTTLGQPPNHIPTLGSNGIQVHSSLLPGGSMAASANARLVSQVSANPFQKGGTLPEARREESKESKPYYNGANKPHFPIETAPTIIHMPKSSSSTSGRSLQSQSMQNGGMSNNSSTVSLSMVELDFSKNNTTSSTPMPNHYPAHSGKRSNGNLAIDMNGSGTNGHSSELEKRTMINSPLDLDTILLPSELNC